MSKLHDFTILIFLNFIAILLGFFLAINLSTILGQTGDWGILSSGLLTAFIETISRVIYKTKKKIPEMLTMLLVGGDISKEKFDVIMEKMKEAFSKL